MKHMKRVAIATLLLLGVSAAAAQSLGDYARAVRKNKPEPSSASRHFDNDNLPTGGNLSVVGPLPAGDAGNANSSAQAATAAAVDPAAAAAERQKTADEWKKKLDQQKEKIDSLNHELDLEQREYRLRAAAMFTDPSISVRNVRWDKDEEQYKSDLDSKQKALAAARQELDEMQEQAHKAGIVEKEKDNDNDKK
jgi:hypothetical protein